MKAQRTETYMKEIDDVLNLAVDFLKQLRSGAPINQILLSELQNAMVALDGLNSIPGEFSEDMAVAMRTVGARVGEIAAIFMVSKEVPVVPVVG